MDMSGYGKIWRICKVSGIDHRFYVEKVFVVKYDITNIAKVQK